MRPVTWCAAAAVLGAVHSAVNAAVLRRPTPDPPDLAASVSVLLPVRNEGTRVAACLRSLLAQQRVAGRLEILVLDDGSIDDTAEVVRSVCAGDARVRLLHGEPLPPGWLGKTYACHQLARAAVPDSEVLVFVDADVVLEPRAIASTVDVLLSSGLDLISPYPRQVAVTTAERVVQPLLQWSWLTFLPLRLAERSPLPSLSAANGQLLAVRRAAYERAGGHAAVAAEILDDVALLRAVKAAGGRGGIVDGTGLATCRMYMGWGDLRDGYTKSLWTAFGSPAGAAGVSALLLAAYLLPALAALRGSRAGLVGYAAGVAGRAITAARTGGRVFPDSLAHPLSVVVFEWLAARSVRRERRGALRWKGRSVPGRMAGGGR